MFLKLRMSILTYFPLEKMIPKKKTGGATTLRSQIWWPSRTIAVFFEEKGVIFWPRYKEFWLSCIWEISSMFLKHPRGFQIRIRCLKMAHFEVDNTPALLRATWQCFCAKHSWIAAIQSYDFVAFGHMFLGRTMLSLTSPSSRSTHADTSQWGALGGWSVLGVKPAGHCKGRGAGNF